LENETLSLVTGAGGFLGGHLVGRLAQRGKPVRAMVLSPRQQAALAAVGVDTVQADLSCPEELRRALQGAGIVYHCAAKLPGQASDEEIQRVNVEGTAALLDASVAAGVRRFVFVSTDSVYGDGHQPAATESTPVRPEYLFEGDYPRSKYAGELLCREAELRHGLAITILRTCMIYGPGESTSGDFFRRWSRKRIHLLFEGGRARLSMIYVTDLADALIVAAEATVAAGQCYNATDGVPHSIGEILQEIALASGRRKTLIPVPKLPAYWACRLLHPIAKRLGDDLANRVDPRKLLFQTADHVMSEAKLREELGFRPQVTLREGLGQTIRWLDAAVDVPVEVKKNGPSETSA